MKKLLTILLLVVACCTAHAQTAWRNPLPIDSTTQRITYSGVVEVPGASKAELYSRAREWFATTFGSSKAVLEMDDREVGKLIGNANERFNWFSGINSSPCRLWRTIKIELKDGRYRYTLSDFRMTVADNAESTSKPIERWFTPYWTTFNKDGSPKRIVSSIIEATQSTARSEIDLLQAAMTKKIGGDW